MTQLALWNDVRLPQAFLDYFLHTGRCINCECKLRHRMHAFNHYKRHHLVRPIKKQKKQKQKFFVWWQQNWTEVSLLVYVIARVDGLPTARTKGEVR